MKKVILALGILVAGTATLSLVSCDKLKKEALKNLNYDLTFQTAETQFTVSPQSNTGTYFDAASASETLDLDKFIKDNTANQLGIDNIKSAKIKSCTLTILNPDAGNNFQNFSMAQVKLNATGQPQLELKIENNPDTYAESLTLPVDASKDMLPYLKAGNWNYMIGGTLRTATTKDLTIKVRFAVDINVGS